MNKQSLKEDVDKVVKELQDLQDRLDNLQDEADIEASGCIEEEAEKRQWLQDAAGQLRRGKDSVKEALNHLEWLV